MIAFYVSGHGYGHAARCGAVIQALRRMHPDCRVAVRTLAPMHLFAPEVSHTRVAVEGAVPESPDALTVDLEASVRSAREFLRHSDEWIRSESQWLRASQARLIAADIPYLAGDLARATGLPGVALGNFLWDWIFQPAADRDVQASIRRGYAGFTQALRMPLSHREGWDVFPSVQDVPLVTPRSIRPRDVIRRELGIRRTAVLIAGRARLTPEVVAQIRTRCSDFQFLLPEDSACFSDLVRAADIAVAKLGYSLAAECIAEKVRIVYPPRCGFREESEILAQQVPHLTPAAPIPVDEWQAGNWRPYLESVMNLRHCGASIETNGSEVCARHLVRAAFPSRRL